jgi:hypothetical protein
MTRLEEDTSVSKEMGTHNQIDDKQDGCTADQADTTA